MTGHLAKSDSVLRIEPDTTREALKPRKYFLHPGEMVTGNIPGLDGLRAISILIVMVSHSGLQNMVPGLFGVTVFFFISGYLITTLLLTEMTTSGSVKLGLFYARRVSRLYPPLLVYLAVVSTICIFDGSYNSVGLFGALFYFANYLYALAPSTIEPFGVHLWSLSVEEHFYLLFPLFFAFGLGRNVSLLILLILGALGLRLAIALLGLQQETYLLVATECRFDSILVGCLTAIVCQSVVGEKFIQAATKSYVVMAALAVILLSLLIRNQLFRETLRFTLQSVALIPIVLACIFTPKFHLVKALMNHPALKMIGILSYSLYLWHVGCFSMAVKLLPSLPSLIQYVVGWGLAFAMAALVYICIERPCFKLRRRFGSRTHESVESA